MIAVVLDVLMKFLELLNIMKKFIQPLNIKDILMKRKKGRRGKR